MKFYGANQGFYEIEMGFYDIEVRVYEIDERVYERWMGGSMRWRHRGSGCSCCAIVDDSDEEALSNGSVRGTTASIGRASA